MKVKTRPVVVLGLSLVVGLVGGTLACDPEPSADCTGFEEEAPSEDWQVDFVNLRDVPVYIEVDCVGQPFSMTDAQGDPVAFAPFGCECFCPEVMEPGEANCLSCGVDCIDFSYVQRLEPGATWSVVLPAIRIVEAAETIPDACVDTPSEVDLHCSLREPAEPGSYTLRAFSSSTLACSSGDCDCEADPELGRCVTTGALGDRVEASTSLEFPGTASIVFSATGG